VSDISTTPVASTWVMVLAAFLLGLPMLGSTVAFAAITSLATIGLYISEQLQHAKHQAAVPAHRNSA
jgi:hypothetical protein